MIAVSACLAGFRCRYDGKDKANSEIVALFKSGGAIPVCPEVMGGMPTPRPASEMMPGGGVKNVNGEDVSACFQKGAEETLRICRLYGITRALLKSRSPSCGRGCIYDGTFSGRTRAGNGITAELLLQNGIAVEAVE